MRERKRSSKLNLNARAIYSVLFSEIAFMGFLLHFHRNNSIERSCLEYRQFELSRVDRCANNSEVINSRAVLSADHSARPQGLSPPLIYSWFQTPASETLFRTSVLTTTGRSPVCTSTSRVVSYVWRCVQKEMRCTRVVPLKVRGECEVGQGRWNGIAVDHVKTKSWYFSWYVKVSILVEFLRLRLFVVSNWWMCVDVCCTMELEYGVSCDWKKEVTRFGVSN